MPVCYTGATQKATPVGRSTWILALLGFSTLDKSVILPRNSKAVIFTNCADVNACPDNGKEKDVLFAIAERVRGRKEKEVGTSAHSVTDALASKSGRSAKIIAISRLKVSLPSFPPGVPTEATGEEWV